MRREIFKPLGMTRCQVGAWDRDVVGNVAQPHMPTRRWQCSYSGRTARAFPSIQPRPRAAFALQPRRHAHLDARVARR